MTSEATRTRDLTAAACLGALAMLAAYVVFHIFFDCCQSSDLRQEAVERGAAKWTIDQEGNRGFEWTRE